MKLRLRAQDETRRLQHMLHRRRSLEGNHPAVFYPRAQPSTPGEADLEDLVDLDDDADALG